jgi:nucleotide-binding universal stress UspA family protein
MPKINSQKREVLSMNDLSDFNPGNILCPIDFSDLSVLALKYATAGACLYGAKLMLLHAELFDLPRYFSQSETDRLVRELQKNKEMIQKDLAGYVTKIIGKAGEDIEIEYESMETHPVDAILQTADKRSVDLIVLGTHGLGGLKRLLLGSVAENVIRQSKVPVFTVRQNEHEFIDTTNPDAVPHVERVLCACEVKESDRGTLKHAASIADRFHARLTVLFSDESQEGGDLSGSRETLCKWIPGTIDTQYDLKPVVRKGSAADQIIAYAKEEKSDLVVIGARHRMFHDSMILGRTTDLVVRHAPTPVLVIPGLNEK